MGSFSRLAPQRYNDASFGVLYTALDIATCRAEVGHYVLTDPGLRASAMIKPLRYTHFVVSFEGVIGDLRTNSVIQSKLVSNDHTFCRSVGAVARSVGFDALQVPSARHLTGTCFPIFTKSTVKEATPTDWYTVGFDPGVTWSSVAAP